MFIPNHLFSGCSSFKYSAVSFCNLAVSSFALCISPLSALTYSAPTNFSTVLHFESRNTVAQIIPRPHCYSPAPPSNAPFLLSACSADRPCDGQSRLCVGRLLLRTSGQHCRIKLEGRACYSGRKTYVDGCLIRSMRLGGRWSGTGAIWRR